MKTVLFISLLALPLFNFSAKAADGDESDTIEISSAQGGVDSRESGTFNSGGMVDAFAAARAVCLNQGNAENSHAFSVCLQKRLAKTGNKGN